MKIDVPIEDKCVICVAPHTSNWDLIIGKLFYNSTKQKTHFLIKKEWFFFPLGSFFRSIGGIPVDRSKRTSITDQVVELFAKNTHFRIGITPEGTRKATSKWRMGFYYIAQKAGVPIQLAYIDYAKKEAGIGKYFYPTGDVEADMVEIKAFYKGIKGKNPTFTI